MSYEDQIFKIPEESSDYQECSNFVTEAIEAIEGIIKEAIDAGENKIVINTNLMDGIMEVVDYNAYDIKYLSPRDISYNSGRRDFDQRHALATQHGWIKEDV